jgi:hypothetical protein
MRLINMNWNMRDVCFLLLLLLVLPSRPAQPQVDLTGEWSPRVYNDHMDVGDYTGIPLKKMKTMKVAPRTTTEHFRRTQ